MWGTARYMRPSRFLKEIPTQYLTNYSLPSHNVQEVETSYDSPEGFSPGDQVRHKEFGKGVIKKAYQGSFGLTYEVHFPHTETDRTLVAKFAKLEPC